jgi:hypothetical protein
VFFSGAFMPYLICWTLYQGTLLMSMLNWTGLVVNGLVAFLLPMILALKTLQLRNQRARSVEITIHPPEQKTSIMIHKEYDQTGKGIITEQVLPEETEQNIPETERLLSPPVSANVGAMDGREQDNGIVVSMTTDLDGAIVTDPENQIPVPSPSPNNLLQNKLLIATDTVEPLPSWLEVYRREITLFMIISFAAIISLTVLNDALEGTSPVEEGEEMNQ